MKKKKEFSKVLLIQESVLVWIVTLAFLSLGFYCVLQGFMGSLSWLGAVVTCTWSAYAVSQGFYYSKAKKENTKGGIKYEATLAELKANKDNKDEGISI